MLTGALKNERIIFEGLVLGSEAGNAIKMGLSLLRWQIGLYFYQNGLSKIIGKLGFLFLKWAFYLANWAVFSSKWAFYLANWAVF